MVMAASLAALLPNAALGHHYVSGEGGAEISLTPDGYPHGGDPGEPYHIGGRVYAVAGTGFALGPVRIFQCPVTPTRTAPVPIECEQVAVAVADLAGTFNVNVRMDDRFISAKYPNGACYGPDFGDDPLAPTSVQCSVLALNHDADGTANMAEHYICFTGMFIGTGPTDTKCVPEP
jgi:hypothetical protein